MTNEGFSSSSCLLQSFLWGMGMAVAFSVVGMVVSSMEEVRLADNSTVGPLLLPTITTNTCFGAAVVRQTTAPGQFEGSVVMPAGEQFEGSIVMPAGDQREQE